MSAIKPVQSKPCAIDSCPNKGDKKCGRCRNIFYCSVTCQQQDWPSHKSACTPLTERKIAQISPPSDPSAAKMLADLKSKASRRNLSQFDDFQKAYEDWSTTVKTPEYLKQLDEGVERELFAFLAFEADSDVYLDGIGGSMLPLYNQFGTVPGITIIEQTDCIQKDSEEDCAYYIFKNEPWYQDLEDKQSLVRRCEGVISFLGERGYSLTLEPKVGDIVAYASAFLRGEVEICHYGIVSKIDDKMIQIDSKWGPGHVYRHPLHFIPRIMGKSYTFLTKSPS